MVIKIGIIVSAIGFALILTVDSFTTAAIYLTIFGLGNGLIRPAVSALLTKEATTGYGEITGFLSSFDSLGRIIGPSLGGLLYGLSVFLPYISGVLLSFIALVVYYLYQRNLNRAN